MQFRGGAQLTGSGPCWAERKNAVTKVSNLPYFIMRLSFFFFNAPRTLFEKNKNMKEVKENLLYMHEFTIEGDLLCIIDFSAAKL